MKKIFEIAFDGGNILVNDNSFQIAPAPFSPTKIWADITDRKRDKHKVVKAEYLFSNISNVHLSAASSDELTNDKLLSRVVVKSKDGKIETHEIYIIDLNMAKKIYANIEAAVNYINAEAKKS